MSYLTFNGILCIMQLYNSLSHDPSCKNSAGALDPLFSMQEHAFRTITCHRVKAGFNFLI